jgi:hypothetical protein
LKKPHALIGLLAGLGSALGVLVAVVGLPYGSTNYTAFAGSYHLSTSAPGYHIIIDCNAGSVGDQDYCIYANTVGTVVVNIELHNTSAPTVDLGAFNFEVVHTDPGTSLNAPVIANPGDTDDNPDFADTGAGSAGTWACSPPAPNPDLDGIPANGDNSFISCFNSDPVGPTISAGSETLLADITYDVPGGAPAVVLPLTFANVGVGDTVGIPMLACGPGECFGATIEITEPPPATSTFTPEPTSTFTPSPTATNTPEGSQIVKIPEGCQEGAPPSPNVDCDIPAANLFLCVNPAPCAGPGEGNLIVFEYARSVATNGDADADTIDDGLGAYEFSVEYNNFVIQSVNPSDVVFTTGPINPYPNGADLVADGEGATRGPADCSMSLTFENIVHFACVTSGLNPEGPEGDMDLARLNLIPHPDLTNDIFPGNDNGVVTVLKDNGCELVDIVGHPTEGDVNGGLTAVCGDLAVTVRILEGDLNLDCMVDLADQQLIAFRYGAFFGSLLYNEWYDLEPNLHDLDIDIKDIQKVFGRDGSNCQNPTPPQPPQGPPAPFGE